MNLDSEIEEDAMTSAASAVQSSPGGRRPRQRAAKLWVKGREKSKL